ncbi:PAS domain-containing protein [Halobaculum sp. WSA2]|uniref:PAS domain-containing protein n=1 Tax=Halobaculum saliterrae TaxID=2073113 RepID=A0A6B0SUY9_9EURY|nr:PAS domain-containing protein [Halobaculum saliterrae]MXR40423.1 PAS domain-containing protein [Halobaculum saliterrae]
MLPSAISAPNGAVIVHSNDEILHVTDAAISLFNTDSRESLRGTSIRDYVATSDYEALADQFNRIEAGSTSALGLTITITDSTGYSREVVTLSSPVKWDGQDHIQTLCIDVDSKLAASELVTNTMETSPIGISIADAQRDDLPLIYVNDGFVEITGYSREEVLGRNCRFLQGDNTRPEPVAKIRSAIKNEEAVTVELRNYRKDGSMFWNRLSIQPVTSDEGDVTHFLGYQEDISAQKTYEQEQALFEMQADAVEKSLFITDAVGRIEYVNTQFEQTTGYSADEVLGQTPRILKSGAQDEAFYQELWETITAGEVWEATITNERKSGERYTVEQKIVPVVDDTGEITHFVSIEDDVTEQAFTEEVLAVMSRVLRHNVRNSVNAIQGYAELLEEKMEDPNDRAVLQVIQSQAKNLETISQRSQDIRELFRRRHEHHTLKVGTIVGFVEQQRVRHPEAQIDLSMEVADDREIQNGSLLQIAIDEALENAVVHSDHERPHVAVTVTEAATADRLCIEIADDGPGIPDQEWDVIFDGQETQLAHGTGIGLWMMYWTITALGGTIERSDNEPRGCVITYHIPLGTSNEEEV